ncbi:MAG: ADP-ribosylglycohydrolase family protein [Clostridia bacterium]|nr:ADP-ribosylglycohydrolase family protein [Clostridia bacterium]
MSAEYDRILSVWEAFAVGDAMGMPTEFMTPDQIRSAVGGLPEDFVPSSLSLKHPNLPEGSVTDDTEQNLYLLAEAKNSGRLSPEVAVSALNRWIEETGAVEKAYIGPSSLRALCAIRDGVPPCEAGKGGTSCGGVMRAPAALLWKPEQSEEELAESIYAALLPTHNTSEALEAAGAYGFARRAARAGDSMSAIFDAAIRGGESLIRRAPSISCAPSSVERLKAAQKLDLSSSDLLEYLFRIWGTGLPSADVCGAVFALFAFAGKDVWLAARLAAVLGGDTDTIGALTAALSAAYAGGNNVPEFILEKIRRVNRDLFLQKLPALLHD